LHIGDFVHCLFVLAQYHCSELHDVTSVHDAFVAWVVAQICSASLTSCKQKIKLQSCLPERRPLSVLCAVEKFSSVDTSSLRKKFRMGRKR